MAISKSYWLLKRVEDGIPDTLLMSDAYLLALVQKSKNLDEKAKVREFFQSWFRVDKYTTEILVCLQ